MQHSAPPSAQQDCSGASMHWLPAPKPSLQMNGRMLRGNSSVRMGKDAHGPVRFSGWSMRLHIDITMDLSVPSPIISRLNVLRKRCTPSGVALALTLALPMDATAFLALVVDGASPVAALAATPRTAAAAVDCTPSVPTPVAVAPELSVPSIPTSPSANSNAVALGIVFTTRTLSVAALIASRRMPSAIASAFICSAIFRALAALSSAASKVACNEVMNASRLASSLLSSTRVSFCATSYMATCSALAASAASEAAF
mmetsp:Transcript_28395/g.45457  ORF Transcript_28395/g.45457 Transcript_28395/m.45457 type:complete len:257 (-) Transcript_28395:872-1642(-)